MRKIAVICGLSLVQLTGCNPSTTEVSKDFVIPPGLHDCMFFDMTRAGGKEVIVVRCPHSDVATRTTVSCGKGCSSTRMTATTEGNEIRDSPYGQ